MTNNTANNPTKSLIEIDGSTGEGGGQMVRSSLALSIITGTPVRIYNLRARRKKPGLARQHLTAVNAAAEICDAAVMGNELHSQELTFNPGNLKSGEFHFRIGTAGSATLVAQTLLPPLMLGEEPSTVRIDGGTHNEKAPPFDYLQHVYLPLVQKMGPKFKTELLAHGFYPAGGGRVSLAITPARKLTGLNITTPIGKTFCNVKAIVSKLPLSIAKRECEKIRRNSNWDANRFEATEVFDSPGPGNAVLIFVESDNLTELFSAIGKLGVKAEQVASSAYREAKKYIQSKAPVGEYLADQLMLPMALAATLFGQSSSFLTTELSDHSMTHIEILKKFLPDLAVTILDDNPNVMVRINKSDVGQ